MILFEEVSEKIKAHPTKTQVLLELCSKEETLDKALSVLEAMGVGLIDYSYIREEAPSLVLLYVSSDVRKIVLNLTEAGFTRIKGINPILKV